jgi:cell division transport system permease protein
LRSQLRARGDVAAVQLRTPAQGLVQLRDRAGLGDAIDALAATGDANPLPYMLLVTPRGDELLLAESLRALPEVDIVQQDAQWRQRLDGWLRFGGRVALVLAALLGLGALLVVGNTVRLDIQSRREEIGVLQLLGASDGFIRRPFLYLGAWYGLAAGGAALGLLTLAWLALRAPLAELAGSYGSHFALAGENPVQAIIVLLGATLLGWLGAGIVTGHYLRQTRPTET